MRLRILVCISLAAAVAGAQTTETPVAFDSAGRLLTVNPPLVSRLGLTTPAWPVTGEFIEARLYRVSTGGHTLAVTRRGGAIDRYSLDDMQAAALQSALADAMLRGGRVVSEDATSIISEPARGPFVRDQMLLATILYGPALATLTDDPAVGSGVYLLSVGGTFFALNDFARRRTVSRAQNALTTDGAIRGWAALHLAASAANIRVTSDGAAFMALAGGIGGSMAGYNRGRTLTHSEAQAAMTLSTLAGAAAGGTSIAIKNNGRMAAGPTLAAGIAGYVMGPEYPRRAPYTVTAGDVQLLRLGAILGAAVAMTPLVETDPSEEATAGILTVGGIAGALVADRVIVKPFNHSQGDARMIQLGAIGGALVGAAIPTMSRSESATLWMTFLTGGALLGTVATQHAMGPAREGRVMREPGGNGANSTARVQFSPEGAILAATGQRGNHTLLRIRF